MKTQILLLAFLFCASVAVANPLVESESGLIGMLDTVWYYMTYYTSYVAFWAFC
jgi:hypothetical protein